MSLFAAGSPAAAEPAPPTGRPRGTNLREAEERDAVPFEMALLAALLSAPTPAWAGHTFGAPGAAPAGRTPDAARTQPGHDPGDLAGGRAGAEATQFDAAAGSDRTADDARYERGTAPSRRAEPAADAASRDAAPGGRTAAQEEHAAQSGPASPAAAASSPAAVATARPALTDAAVRAAVVAALRAAGSASAATPSPAKALDPRALADAWAARLQKLEAAAVKSGSTFVVPLDTGDGAAGQVHLAVRGKSLTATLISGDADVRRQLESSLGDLQKALLGRGFEDAQVRVRAPKSSEREQFDRQPDAHSGGGQHRSPRGSRRTEAPPSAGAAAPFILEKGSSAS